MKMRRGWKGIGLPGAVIIALGGWLPGTAAQERPLGSPLESHPVPFGLVNTVRELPDGSVLVADPLGGVLVRLAPGLQRADTLGRTGSGPGEFRQPDAVWPHPGDSTLVVDLGNARLTLLSAEGRPGRTRPLALGEPGPGGPPLLLLPRGVDAGGRLYIEGPRLALQGTPPDSVDIQRLGPVGSEPERLARVRLPASRQQSSGSGGNVAVRVTPVPLSPVDAWGVGMDGSVAVARSEPFRLEWIRPDGRVVRGPDVPWRPVPIREAEREEWDRERGRSGGGIAVGMTVQDGRTTLSFGRGGVPGVPGTGGARADLEAMPWPAAKPPFVGGTVWVDPLGRAWVRLSRPAGEAPLFQLFDGEGRPVVQVRFPPDRRLVGFGDGALYAVHVDEMDLQRLERYRLPGQ